MIAANVIVITAECYWKAVLGGENQLFCLNCSMVNAGTIPPHEMNFPLEPRSGWAK